MSVCSEFEAVKEIIRFIVEACESLELQTKKRLKAQKTGLCYNFLSDNEVFSPFSVM